MSTSQGRQVLVPGGRIVWTGGDLFKGRVKTEFNTKTPKLNAQGQQIVEYSFGLAIPKSELQPGGSAYPLWLAIFEEAYSIYPSRQLPPAFALKYKDGDGVDDKGQPFAQREGYAGHLVFALSTTIPITFFRYENGQNIQVPSGIKCGDYVTVQLSVKAHGPQGQGKPGMYLNPIAVQLAREGKEIINRPTGDQIFGQSAPVIPQGVNYQAPEAPTAMLVPQGAPTPGFAPPTQPVQQQAPVQPHYGVVPQGLQPQQPQAAPAPGFVAPQQQTMPAPGGFPPPQGGGTGGGFPPPTF